MGLREFTIRGCDAASSGCPGRAVVPGRGRRQSAVIASRFCDSGTRKQHRDARSAPEIANARYPQAELAATESATVSSSLKCNTSSE